jgi:hypothetical protein
MVAGSVGLEQGKADQEDHLMAAIGADVDDVSADLPDCGTR